MVIFRSPHPDVPLSNLPLAEFVFENHNKYPDRIALIDGKTGFKLTYQQLYAKVVAVAFHLHHKFDVRKSDVIAIYSPNRWEYPVAFHGIALSGAITTPMNPFYTVDELAHQIKLTKPRMIITVPENLDKVKQVERNLGKKFEHIILFGKSESDHTTDTISFEKLFDKPSHALPELSINTKEDIVVLPTSSGTTGMPKAVMLTHSNLVNNALQMNPYDGFNTNTVLLAVLPMYHIYGLECFLVALLRSGGTLVISTKFVFEDMLKFIETYKVNAAYLVPPIIIQLAKSPKLDPSKLTSLKWIMSAAAPLDGALAARCSKRLNVTITQAYGMTELSPMTHMTPKNRIKDGSAGVLLPNTECRIVNLETGHDVGVGEEGEMVIKGPQSMKGYLDNTHATANTLVNGWVHTGDIVKIDEDGYYYIVDRMKELIKVKGFQVAPAELEAILLNHSKVGDAAVISIPDPESGELPHAFVVLKHPSKTVTQEELKKYVAEKVVPYKRLQGITFIDAIPRNPSGKILRRLLKTKVMPQQMSKL